MSVDVLQEKIRKCKSPLMLSLQPELAYVPEKYAPRERGIQAYSDYCEELLPQLQDCICGVMVSYGAFAVYGQEGLEALNRVQACARGLGYYVLCDLAAGYTGALSMAWGEEVLKHRDFDAMALCAYAGSDAVKPLLPFTKEGKLLLVHVKTPNKSAVEIQDLICGGRLVYSAVAELASRCGQGPVGRFGYTQVGWVMSANAPRSIETVRGKFRELFLLVSGLDETGGNAKNAALAFDRLGHGAAVCAGGDILGAWQMPDAPQDALRAAVDSANRLKKNILRYVTIL